MEKIFFAFLDELAHSKQFKKSRENDLLLTPPPLVGKIPDNSGLFLLEGFPKYVCKTFLIFNKRINHLPVSSIPLRRIYVVSSSAPTSREFHHNVFSDVINPN